MADRSLRILGALGMAAGTLLYRRGGTSKYVGHGLLAAGAAICFLPDVARVADSLYRKHEINSLQQEMDDYARQQFIG